MALIDPATSDYVTASLALPMQISLLDAARLRVSTPLGSWWADPKLGSQLYLLKKDVPQSAVLAQRYTQTALQPMVKDGRLSRVVVNAQRITKGRVDITAYMYPPQGGNPVVLNYFVKVGG